MQLSDTNRSRACSTQKISDTRITVCSFQGVYNTPPFRWLSCGVPPVPIPNTEVKPTYTDNTWLATAREDRQPPDPQRTFARESFFFLPEFSHSLRIAFHRYASKAFAHTFFLPFLTNILAVAPEELFPPDLFRYFVSRAGGSASSPTRPYGFAALGALQGHIFTCKQRW